MKGETDDDRGAGSCKRLSDGDWLGIANRLFSRLDILRRAKMATTSVLNKIYDYAAANFSDGDFHALVGKTKCETKSVFDRFPNDGSDLKAFVDPMREGQDFFDLMGVVSCYSAFMTKEEAAKALGFTLDEWGEIKQILRW